MSGPAERTVQVNGQPCRVWEAGQGEPLGYLAGLGGLPRWSPLLERLAAKRRVIVPSLPGFPGGLGHDALDSHLDWLVATRDLLNAAGLTDCDLVGVSVGGALAADVAAVWPHKVRRLALLGPFGLFDPAAPVTDVFAQAPGKLAELVCAEPGKFKELMDAPEDAADPTEWNIVQTRAMEAAARLLWPLGDTRLARRLGRIRAPTLLLWGEADRVVPPAYAQAFATGMSAPTQTQTLPGAGHLADIDQPEAVAQALLAFFA